jgi:hypothetical protein
MIKDKGMIVRMKTLVEEVLLPCALKSEEIIGQVNLHKITAKNY